MNHNRSSFQFQPKFREVSRKWCGYPVVGNRSTYCVLYFCWCQYSHGQIQNGWSGGGGGAHTLVVVGGGAQWSGVYLLCPLAPLDPRLMVSHRASNWTLKVGDPAAVQCPIYRSCPHNGHPQFTYLLCTRSFGYILFWYTNGLPNNTYNPVLFYNQVATNWEVWRKPMFHRTQAYSVYTGHGLCWP